MLFANVTHGVLEGMAFGFINGFLRKEDYTNLSQCETLAEFKSQLMITDYGPRLAQLPKLSSRTIADSAMRSLVEDFNTLRSWAAPDLGQFLDFVTYEYMLGNVLKIVTANRMERDGYGLAELTRCHPLGAFDTMSAMTAAETVQEMVEVVLIDSPIGHFFKPSFYRDLDNMSIEFVRAMLEKSYLEGFYEYVLTLGGETEEIMRELLEFEADRLVMCLIKNTLTDENSDVEMRLRLLPTIGELVPIHDQLASCTSQEQLIQLLQPNYPTAAAAIQTDRVVLSEQPNSSTSLERHLMEIAAKRYRNVMRQQFQFGLFYAWIKLKELEVQNIWWMAECITQSNHDEAINYIRIAY